MADDFKIQGMERITPHASQVNPASRRKKKKKKPKDEAGRHFRELARKAEQAHQVLSQKKSPYRFCVYQKDGEVFVDVAIVDADSRTTEIYKRNITHDEFQSWMNLIETESGLIFDKEV